MLNDMLAYSTAMLSAVAEFLSSEPMIYILGFIAVAIVFKIISTLLGKKT